MIDNYLLEELVTFASEKTLAKTAEKLNVTQPTVTRGMQKLEDELGIQLFDRQPNRIVLTDTGKLAAEKATEVLAVNRNFVQQLQNYAARQSIIKIASIAPGPLILLTPICWKIYAQWYTHGMTHQSCRQGMVSAQKRTRCCSQHNWVG